MEEEAQQRDPEPGVHVRQRPDLPQGRHPHQQPLQQGHPNLPESQDLLFKRGEFFCSTCPTSRRTSRRLLWDYVAFAVYPSYPFLLVKIF